jgi:hypothetical protein
MGRELWGVTGPGVNAWGQGIAPPSASPGSAGCRPHFFLVMGALPPAFGSPRSFLARMKEKRAPFIFP